jgi:hypothetical protein
VTILVPTTPQWLIRWVESAIEPPVTGICRMNGSIPVMRMAGLRLFPPILGRIIDLMRGSDKAQLLSALTHAAHA